MPELGPEHPVTFRQETASVFFDRYVKAGESCVIVGVAGGGLRRLEFPEIKEPDVVISE